MGVCVVAGALDSVILGPAFPGTYFQSEVSLSRGYYSWLGGVEDVASRPAKHREPTIQSSSGLIGRVALALHDKG